MKELVMQQNKDTLGIQCTRGKIEMTGSSILPDPRKFFKPVVEWVEGYVQDPAEKTEITLKFEYIDTASVQQIFDVLNKFRQIPNFRTNVTVNWYFEFDDPELLEVGEIMEGRLQLNFNFIEYSA